MNAMNRGGAVSPGNTDREAKVRTGWAIGAVAVGMTLCGCVTVNAPDKPIEINLNIKITQEVVYRFDGDAKRLIEENADIF